MNVVDERYKTPREVALEQEIKELRRELEAYRHMVGPNAKIETQFGDPVEFREMSSKLIKGASVRVAREEWKPYKTSVIGWAKHPHDARNIEFAWYVDEMALQGLAATDPMAMLSVLQDRAVRQLAEIIRKEKMLKIA